MSYRALMGMFLLCATAGCVTPTSERPPASLKVDNGLRSTLDHFVNPSTPASRDLALRQLKAEYNSDPSAVIAQATLLDISRSEPGDTTSTPTLSAIIQPIAVTKEDIFLTAAPLLTTSDPVLHARLLNLVKYAGLDRAREYIKAHPVDDGNGVPEALLLDDPDSALSFLTQTYPLSDAERNRLAHADTVMNIASRAQAGDPAIAAGQAQAEELSDSARWWVRYYTAMMIGRTPAILNDRTTRRLMADSDFRVRMIAQQRNNKPQG